MIALATILKNYKTTLGGVAAMLAGLSMLVSILQGNGSDGQTWALAIGLIGAGWAGITGRDADKSSEDSGVK
jgi:hypothetical protein